MKVTAVSQTHLSNVLYITIAGLCLKVTTRAPAANFIEGASAIEFEIGSPGASQVQSTFWMVKWTEERIMSTGDGDTMVRGAKKVSQSTLPRVTSTL